MNYLLHKHAELYIKFCKRDEKANLMIDEKFCAICMLPLFILLVAVEHPSIGRFKTTLWVVFLEAVYYAGMKWGIILAIIKKRYKVIDTLLNFIGPKTTKDSPDQMMERIGRFYGSYLLMGIIMVVAFAVIFGLISLVAWLIGK